MNRWQDIMAQSVGCVAVRDRSFSLKANVAIQINVQSKGILIHLDHRLKGPAAGGKSLSTVSSCA